MKVVVIIRLWGGGSLFGAKGKKVSTIPFYIALRAVTDRAGVQLKPQPKQCRRYTRESQVK